MHAERTPYQVVEGKNGPWEIHVARHSKAPTFTFDFVMPAQDVSRLGHNGQRSISCHNLTRAQLIEHVERCQEALDHRCPMPDSPINSDRWACEDCGGTGSVRVHSPQDYGVSFECEGCETCSGTGVDVAALRAENERLREVLAPFVYKGGCDGQVLYCARGEEKCRWCNAAELAAASTTKLEPWQSGTYADVGNINFPPGQDSAASDEQQPCGTCEGRGYAYPPPDGGQPVFCPDCAAFRDSDAPKET